MTQLTQFYKVVVTSKNKDENGKFKEVDITPDIPDGLSYEDEDGTIRSCSFKLREGYAYTEVLSKGLKVTLTCGSLENPKTLLTGRIDELEPQFEDTGEIILSVKCTGTEGAKLGKKDKDLIYPSNNHPNTWATSPLMYSEIIKNLAKEVGFIVQDENISVIQDIEANFKNPVKQHKCNDWKFIQQLAKKINCTAWIESYGSSDYLFLKDNNLVTDKLANVTLFYLPRVGNEFVETSYSQKNRIKMQKVNITLESKKKGITKKTDPVTGKDTIEAEGVGEEGERYVLDEDKLRGLSRDRRRELIELFVSGDITWEGDDGTVAAKDYFKLVTKDSESSRTGTSNNVEIEVAGEQLDKNGVNTVDGTTETTGKVSYKTVIDQDKLEKLSPEERAGIMGRIVRKELTEKDRELYTVVTTTEKKEDDTKDNAKKNSDVASSTGKTKKKNKRDAGFKIEVTIWGSFLFQSRLSYVLEGLGKYSGSYYLYRVRHTFGNNGWMTTLIFTK